MARKSHKSSPGKSPRKKRETKRDVSTKPFTLVERCWIDPLDLRSMAASLVIKFQCPIENCPRAFLQRSNLKSHLDKHFNLKTKKCNECPYETADPGSFTRHKKDKHGYKPKPRFRPAQQFQDDSPKVTPQGPENVGSDSAAVLSATGNVTTTSPVPPYVPSGSETSHAPRTLSPPALLHCKAPGASMTHATDSGPSNIRDSEYATISSVSVDAPRNSLWDCPSLYRMSSPDLMSIDPAPTGRSVWSHPSNCRAPFSMRPTPSLPSDYESTSPETSLSPLTPSDGSPINQPRPLLGSCSSPPPSERQRPTSHGVAPPPWPRSRLENSDYSDRRYGPEGTRVLHQATWDSSHRDNHTYRESDARNSSNGSFASTTPRVQIYNQDNQEGRTRDFSPLPYYSRETGYRGSYYQEPYYGRAASRSDGSYNHHRYEPSRYTDSSSSSSNMDVDVYPGTSSNNHHAPSRPVDTRPTVTLPSIRSLEDVSEHLLRPIDMFRFQNGRDDTTNLNSSPGPLLRGPTPPNDAPLTRYLHHAPSYTLNLYLSKTQI
ncbi:hypothetical protein K435DRAFT_836768 [Dendrothele bispora CBS 962.96]|uniref:C2H2-type domain-containing protein n=1 Tax=Dendrothele bispora (strain CBS 962.96) TaxID=1314807 RepID=A0A4S8MGR8_DENBC|nr:hypothetical protein K435DRAFT_836768 [Dendrothele bispora CBS 962.96]